MNNHQSIMKLKIEKTWTGLYGRFMVDLRDCTKEYLPANRIGVGDVVQLVSSGNDTATPSSDAQGIVTKVSEKRICVAFDDSDDEMLTWKEPVRLNRLANDATYRKISTGLDLLAKMDTRCGGSGEAVPRSRTARLRIPVH